MKRSTTVLFSSLFLLSFLVSIRAATPVWTCVTDDEVLWQHSAAFGYLVVCTKASLSGIDDEKGTVLWTNKQFASMSEDALTEITGTPFFMAVNRGETAIIDGFSGVRVFSAKEEGFTTINRQIPMYKCGGMLVIGKKGQTNATVFTNISDGKKRWELSGTDFVFSAFEIDNNSVLVATAFNLYRLDALTGKEMWKAPISQDVQQLDNMGALGGLIKKVAAKNAERNPVTAIELYVKPEINSFFLAAEILREEQVTTSDGKTTKSQKPECSYNGFNLSNGSFLWQEPYKLDGKLATALPSDDGLILINAGNVPMPGMAFNMGGNGDVKYPQVNINMIGYKDGKAKWGKDGRGLKLRDPALKILKSERGIICVTEDAVNIIDQRSGTLVFDKDVKVFSDIRDVMELPSGLLLCSDDELTILDLKTKKPLWNKPLKTAPGLYALNGNKLYVFSTKDKKVYTSDLASGAAPAVLSKAETKFEGGEKPKKIELRSNGVLLKSEQNLELISEDGSSVYKVYFPAPRDPGILRALYYADAVYAAYYGAQYGMASIQLADASQKTDNVIGKAVTGAFSEAYGAVSYSAFGAAGDAFKRANARYKATGQTKDFVFMLTKTDKTCALLQVNKADGKVIETIDLGKDKKPVYSVDDLAGKVYYRAEPKKIVNYKL